MGWVAPKEDRGSMMGNGRQQLLTVSWALLLLMFFSFSNEWHELISHQKDFYSASQKLSIFEDSMAYNGGTEAQFREQWQVKFPSEEMNEVHLLVMGGLRADRVAPYMPAQSADISLLSDPNPLQSPGWQSLLGPEGYGDDSLVCFMRTPMPSMSLPAWLNILSGVPPETSGVLGQSESIGETTYDTIMAQGSDFNVTRGMTSVAWFSDIVKSKLPPLMGHGTVTSSHGVDETTKPDTHSDDMERFKVLEQASEGGNYKLFVAHFSNADSQAHNAAGGAESLGYAESIVNQTTNLWTYLGMLKMLAANRDRNITVLITSDHGHVNSGGSGAISQDQALVPLVLYRPATSFNDGTVDPTPTCPSDWKETPACDPATTDRCTIPAWVPQITDIATTVAGLLKLPVPRHAHGRFMEFGGLTYDVEQWRDLFHQRQALTINFLKHEDVAIFEEKEEEYGDLLGSLKTECAACPQVLGGRLNDCTGSKSDECIAWYKEKIEVLQGIMESARSDQIAERTLRNCVLSTLIGSITMLVVMYVVHTATYCDPITVFIGICRKKKDQSVADWANMDDVKACALCFVLLAAYYMFCLGCFYGFYHGMGYGDEWSICLLHNFRARVSFGLVVLIPGLLGQYLITRIVLMKYMEPPTLVLKQTGDMSAKAEKFFKLLKMFLFSEVTRFNDKGGVAAVYLCRFYLLIISILGAIILWSIGSQFTFIIPLMYNVPYIDQNNWDARFRFLTVKGMTLPLVFGMTSGLVMWKKTCVDIGAMTQLNNLKITKAKQYQGIAGTQDLAMVIQNKSNKQDWKQVWRGAKGNRISEQAQRELLQQKGEEVKMELETLKVERDHMAQHKNDVEQQLNSVRTETDAALQEARHNQDLISQGIQELQKMMMDRFEAMEQEDKKNREQEKKDLEESANGTMVPVAAPDAEQLFEENPELGIGAQVDAEDYDERLQRHERLWKEQQRRIQEEEEAKRADEEKIKRLEQELTQVVDDNARLQKELDRLKTNNEEAQENIEDVEFSIAQIKATMENQTKVLHGEMEYLETHAIKCHKKVDQLRNDILELEGRVKDCEDEKENVQKDLDTKKEDMNKNINSLQKTAAKGDKRFQQLSQDVKILYKEKKKLEKQLELVKADTRDAIECAQAYQDGFSQAINEL